MSIRPATLTEVVSRYWALEGTHNLRDVGGYPARAGSTRWHTLLRSDSLHRLPASSQRSLIEYGLQMVIDLRTEEESATAPDVFAYSDAVGYVHLPMLAPHIIDQHRAETLEDLYLILVERCQNQIGYVVSLLADGGAVPAIVHCSAGKDRTGLVIAVLQDLVGVDRETIVEDYLQTARHMAELRADLRSTAAQIGYNLERLDRMLECRANAIVSALDHIDSRYGGTREYVRAAGIEDDTLERLHSLLVESSNTAP